MEKIKILIILELISTANLFLLLPSKNLLVEAVKSYVDSNEIFTLSLINVRQNIAKEVAGSLVAQSNLRYSVQIQSFESAPNAKIYKNDFVIIFVDDLKQFLEFSTKFLNASFPRYFMIIIEDHMEIENIFKLLWKKFIFNVNVLVKARSISNVSLFTFLPFNGKSCDDMNAVKVNEFDDAAMKWKSEIFFPKKFRNLHNCPINVGTFDNPPGIIISNSSNGSTVFAGKAFDFLTGLASSLNFSLNVKIYPTDTGHFFKNKTGTGLLNKAYTGEVEVIVGILSLQESRTAFLSASSDLYFDKTILVIPSALPIDSLKKLLLPFEYWIWIGLVIYLFVAFCILTALRFSPQKFNKFVIGQSVKNEYLNIWNILLGVSLTKLPGRNFARFLLMSFTMFCLVIRSSYIGSLFNILKNDINSREITGIDELNDLGYTFYIYDSLAERLKDALLINR